MVQDFLHQQYSGYIGIMENKMETAIIWRVAVLSLCGDGGLATGSLRVEGFALRASTSTLQL